MLKSNRGAMAVLAASLLLTPSLLHGQETSAPSGSSDLTGLQDTVRSLTEQLNAQRGELDGLRGKLAKSETATQSASGEIAARDASLRTAQGNQAAAEARAQDLQKQLDAARAELSATKDAQRALSEQAESVAATAAAQETRVNELQATLDKQRTEVLAARNDLDSAQRAVVDKDKQIQALTNAGRELVASAEALETEKKALGEQLATSQGNLEGLQRELGVARSELLAARNDLGSAERALAEKDKQLAALANVGRELVAGGEELAATNLSLESQLADLTGPGETFMAALAQSLGPDNALQVVDGRLVFPSDLAFAPGAANLSPAARAKAMEYGQAIAAALAALPDDSPWFLRVDGHTDRQRVGGRRFTSNRELAAARALAVTDVLIEAGVPPERIAPAAFGEFRPVDPAETPEAYQANRRIELELDED